MQNSYSNERQICKMSSTVVREILLGNYTESFDVESQAIFAVEGVEILRENNYFFFC